ncbi:alpha/beta fold hydrolase [Bacillus sp. FJAT-29814]|uniref:alpha/beta fold hydrolase n=1 Tax=Bacillus sp. FJAT-29814 TaxID=1729688 RepID=UPI000A90F4CC|nr:alpha/beta fold hydrolase [Bacillus sp. FJAT-29814]
MATKTSNQTILPTFNYEKELERWTEFANAIMGPELSTNHTPRKRVWVKNKATLWHYAPAEKKYDIPVFMIYSLFNQPSILDFAPGSSVIEGLVNNGYDVYLLDWGIAGYEDKDMNIEDYIADYIPKAVKRALRHSRAEEVSVIGYCLGGTFAMMYAAIAEEPIRNLIVATVPIDFSVSMLPDKWEEELKESGYNADRLIEVFGVIPPAYVEAMFRSVTAPIYNSPYVTLLTRANDERFVEKWKRMNKWNSGHVPLTGGAFRQMNTDFFKENKLVKGEFTIHGQKVDLGKITANLLVVSSKNDTLIPECQSLPLMDLVSSQDKTYLSVEAGHVSLAMTGKLNGILEDWLGEHSK